MSYKNGGNLMAGTREYVICLMCLHNQLLDKPGKGAFTIGNWNAKTGDFIQIRDATGGRTKDGKSHGFPKVDALTLHDAVLAGNSEYNKVIKQMKEQLLKVVQAFYDEDIITKTELNSIK